MARRRGRRKAEVARLPDRTAGELAEMMDAPPVTGPELPVWAARLPMAGPRFAGPVSATDLPPASAPVGVLADRIAAREAERDRRREERRERRERRLR